ncbi:MAG: hypothetical protein OEZ36_03765 [Spirochaetota bacterium]|nr:hypothetical protein [Spirochaetota bacterium]
MPGKIFLISILSLVVLYAQACGKPVKPRGYDGVEVVTKVGDNYFKAIHAAIRVAVKTAIIKIIGPDSYRTHRATINNTILKTKYNHARKYTVSHTILGRNKDNGQHTVTIRAWVNVPKLVMTLSELGIKTKDPASLSSSQTGDLKKKIPGIDALKRESFMVHFDEENLNIPLELATRAVQRINGYLASQNLNYINKSQITSLKKQRQIMDDEDLTSPSALQIMARKLHADVYILLNARVDDGIYQKGKYITRGSLSLTAFESSTARGLGSVELSHTKKGGDLTDAQNQLILETAPRAAKRLLASIISYKSRPHLYILIIQGNIDHEARKTFQRSLEKDPNTVGISLSSATKRHVRYEIRYKGMTRDLLDGIFRRLKEKDGFEALKVKLLRRKGITLTI